MSSDALQPARELMGTGPRRCSYSGALVAPTLDGYG